MENTPVRWLRDRSDGQLLVLTAIILLPFKAWLTWTAGIEMHFDEAQYWEWSQQLDWSYYSKGPLIAWLIALSEFLFGHGEWQTRLFGWIAHAALLALMFHFTRHVWNSRAAGWWAVLIVLLTPMYFTLSLVMTTDNLLLLFWAWGLWAAWRALILERPHAWLEAGTAVGLGGLTKLSIGLLPLMIGLLVLLRPRWRHHLRDRHLWLGLLLMLACMSPVLLWNASHDWVMLRHEQGHIESKHWSLTSGLEFLAGQWLALSPIVVTLAIALLWRRPCDDGRFFLWITGLAWLVFFLVKSMTGKMQINWPAPAYLGLIVLFSGAIANMSVMQRRILYAGLVSSIILMAVAYFPQQFGLKGNLDPFIKSKYWRAPIERIAVLAPTADFILTDRYHLAAELAYYWPQRVPVYITGSSSRRLNQHDLWPSIGRERGRNALYIIDDDRPHPLLAQAFARCIAMAPLEIASRDGIRIRTLHPYHCENYQDIVWPQPPRH